MKALVLPWLPLCCGAKGVKVTQTGTNLYKVIAFFLGFWLGQVVTILIVLVLAFGF